MPGDRYERFQLAVTALFVHDWAVTGIAIIDFFVSYTRPDVGWAEWIAWQLEQEGYTTTIQAWDFRPGQDFVLAMQDASVGAKRTIGVLSPAFFGSPYTRREWSAAFKLDPDGKLGKFVPVRVRDCQPPGLHGSVVYIDLVGLGERAARAKLLEGVRLEREGVRLERTKPESAPTFPGAGRKLAEAPGYPGEAPPIWNVPIATRTFEGRSTALTALAGEPADDGRAAVTQTQVVHGLGGVGKTQLVARFAHEHRGEYDVVWWIRAEQEATRLEDYAALGAKLGLAEAIATDQGTLVAATKAWLERSRRWLLIFDNTPEPEAIASLLPAGKGGHVMVTSRRHADWRALGATPLQLNVWERQESVDFLSRSTGSLDRQAAGEIAELLGDLPLALAQAAAYTNEQVITLRTYHARLAERAGALLARGKPLDYEHTVATTWDLAFEQIGERQPVRSMFATCAYLGPERIPRELLSKQTIVEPNTPAGLSTETLADDAIQVLLNYALLTPAADDTLDMHRLVQRVIREREAVDTQKDSAAAAVKLVQQAFPDTRLEPESWPRCSRLLAHALAATKHAQALDTARPETASLLAMSAIYLQSRADFQQSKDLLKRALKIKEQAYGTDHPGVASALGELGIVLHELGELPAALAAHERALKIKEQAYGPDHPDVAKTLDHFGISLRELGKPSAARTAHERALKIREQAYGPEHPDVAKTLSNLGMVLQDLNELPAALAAQERALKIEEKAYGLDHPDVAKTLGNLGNVLQDLNELPAALAAQERALKIEEKAYGPDHHVVAKTLGNLGNVLKKLKELPAALAAQERALKIEEKAYGPDHHEVARTLSNLGMALEDLNELPAALGAQERALKIQEQVYGPDHHEVARTLSNLGDVLKKLKELAAARTAFQRAAEIFEKTYGPAHPLTRQARSASQRLGSR